MKTPLDKDLHQLVSQLRASGIHLDSQKFSDIAGGDIVQHVMKADGINYSHLKEALATGFSGKNPSGHGR